MVISTDCQLDNFLHVYFFSLVNIYHLYSQDLSLIRFPFLVDGDVPQNTSLTCLHLHTQRPCFQFLVCLVGSQFFGNRFKAWVGAFENEFGRTGHEDVISGGKPFNNEVASGEMNDGLGIFLGAAC